VRRMRTDRGWSQRELSDRLKAVGCWMQEQVVGLIERGGDPRGAGRRTISVDEVVAFAQVFGVSFAELLDGSDVERGERLRSHRDRVLLATQPILAPATTLAQLATLVAIGRAIDKFGSGPTLRDPARATVHEIVRVDPCAQSHDAADEEVR
jgi:transcriptional regulator with XRE-family HTH domain